MILPPEQNYTTRPLQVGNVSVGGGAPVTVQSMCNTDTRDLEATRAQILALASAGCEIVRCAVPDMDAAQALPELVRGCPLPLVADIHFDYRLALQALEAGVDCLRINPGNIGARWKVAEVVSACRERQVPIRIGVNAGSLGKRLLKKYDNEPCAEAMVESALHHIDILDRLAAKDVDALVSIPIDQIATAKAYRNVAAGAKIVFIDNVPKGFEHPNDYAGTVSSDNRGLGIFAGRFLRDRVGSGTVGLLTFALGALCFLLVPIQLLG